jgi:hypothetical protein
MPTPEEFLAEFPEPVQALAHRLRALVRQTVPNSTEAVYAGWQLIGYRVIDGKRSAYFAFILPRPDRVLLGFEYGALLSDPDGLLTTGGKQVRQMTIQRARDIRPTKLTLLIREAADIGTTPKELKRQLLLERDAIRHARRRSLP